MLDQFTLSKPPKGVFWGVLRQCIHRDILIRHIAEGRTHAVDGSDPDLALFMDSPPRGLATFKMIIGTAVPGQAAIYLMPPHLPPV